MPCSRDVWADGAEARRLVGYVPDVPILYEGLTARELMKSFSLGMKRKMAIAAALVHRPQVLLLDEATNGLDPRATREVKDFILEAAQAGAAVFLTTHLLDVAQELAVRIAVIHRGEVRAVGSLAELQEQAGRSKLRLVHISPALAWSVLSADVATGLPGRAWSILFWAGMLAQLLPGGAWWWAIPALWLVGVTWGAVLVMQLGLMYYAIYLVLTGQPLQTLESLGWWVMGTLGVVLGLPGAVMLAWLAAAPGRAGNAYREGWLALAELGDAAEDPEAEGFSAALEQAPRGVFSVAGMVAAGLLGAGAVLWPHPVIALLPVAALAAGYLRLRKLMQLGA